MAESTLCALRILVNSKGNIEVEKSVADVSGFRQLLDAFDVDGVDELCCMVLDVQSRLQELNDYIIDKYKAVIR